MSLEKHLPVMSTVLVDLVMVIQRGALLSSLWLCLAARWHSSTVQGAQIRVWDADSGGGLNGPKQISK